MIGDKNLLYNNYKPLKNNLEFFKVEDLPQISDNFNGQIIIVDENNKEEYIFDIRNGKLTSINLGELK